MINKIYNRGWVTILPKNQVQNLWVSGLGPTKLTWNVPYALYIFICRYNIYISLFYVIRLVPNTVL